MVENKTKEAQLPSWGFSGGFGWSGLRPAILDSKFWFLELSKMLRGQESWGWMRHTVHRPLMPRRMVLPSHKCQPRGQGPEEMLEKGVEQW